MQDMTKQKLSKVRYVAQAEGGVFISEITQ
ncbi:MAG: Unknown protein [uncultured Thiotrichaceae bacterium]|uniref:Uncharacterized protein n=1 Tax=uncultured Thiotrichaceae bacterium TaxID=298394 RepID=A0A6S6T231_9GAMM|nr:MAG: Unknown protein [uncultured Thiotrichaceae bacterium]